MCVCRKRRGAIDPSQRKRKGTEHRQLLSKPRQRSILNKSTEKGHITNNRFHTHRPMWNEKETKQLQTNIHKQTTIVE